MRAEGDQRKGQLALGLLPQRAGDADAGGRRQLLQPRGHVDAVAQQVAALRHHVAKIDADSEFHALRRRQVGIAPLQRPLHGNRRSQGLHCAREFREHTVSGGVENPPVMLGD